MKKINSNHPKPRTVRIKKLWDYDAKVVSIQDNLFGVYDGDTCHLEIAVGFYSYIRIRCRLAYINAPELNSPIKEIRDAAILSRDHLRSLLPNGTEIYIISKSLDKYGRPLVEIWINDFCVNKDMIDKGFATKY